jgi:hypothetical protein
MTGKKGQYESFEPKLARLVTASALDTAKVPALQFCEIQTS